MDRYVPERRRCCALILMLLSGMLTLVPSLVWAATLKRVTYDFEDKRQGRYIGVSAIRAINDDTFLIVERDNRGIGPENPVNADLVAADVGVKRVYEIDISGATDVSDTGLAGMGLLPADVVPVSKSLVLDIQAMFDSSGLITPEKTEGLTIGPQLDNGQYALLVSSDNDSSVLLTDAGELLDVFTDGSVGPLDGDAAGRLLMPTYLLSFTIDLPGFVRPEGEAQALLPGDADLDYDFDQIDLVKVQQAAVYLTGRAATWGQGDWNGAPGGSVVDPPTGDGVFDQLDIVAALSAGIYLTGPYASVVVKDDSKNVFELAMSLDVTALPTIMSEGLWGPSALPGQPRAASTASVPEPATVLPLTLGLMGFFFASFRFPRRG